MADNLKRKHHDKQKFCYSRPSYREARWERSVKVYTINLESKYLLVQGVPSVGVTTELLELFALYGAVEEYQILDDYPAEQFTKVYWIKFQKINAARIAKKKLDNKSFFGGVLHVCYAPEYEKVDDTREKLQERRKAVARKCKEYYGVEKMESADHNKQNEKLQASETKDTMSGKYQLDITQNTSQSQTDKSITDESYSTSKSQNQSCYGANDDYNLLQLPPPPMHLHPTNFPQPLHPPWDLPRVPTAHATLPLHLQNLPPPPPPPPPLTVSSSLTFTAEAKKMIERTTINTTSTDTSVTVSLCGVSMPLPIVPSIQRTITKQSTLPGKPLNTLACSSQKDVHTKPDFHTSVTHLQQPYQSLEPVPTASSTATKGVSFDLTVQAVRHKMKVVDQRSTSSSVAKKKRKRI